MIRFVASLAIVAAVMVAGPASAESLTVVRTDPVGDARLHAPAYLDEVRAEATRTGQNFEFRTVVAESIPLTVPHLPPGNAEVWWLWGLDTDPTTFPPGYPVAPGQPLGTDFQLRVSWDGSEFAGTLVDRRPLLTGGEAVLTPYPFTIAGNEVSMAVQASAIGNPTSFLWAAVTVYRASPPGSAGFHIVDKFDPNVSPGPS
jgi:hypothetical protein